MPKFASLLNSVSFAIARQFPSISEVEEYPERYPLARDAARSALQEVVGFLRTNGHPDAATLIGEQFWGKLGIDMEIRQDPQVNAP